MQSKPFSHPKMEHTEQEINEITKECRICLESAHQDNPLIIPCNCSGSIKYVHRNCIRQWVQIQYDQNINKIQCQLCKQPIMYQLQKKSSYNSCDKVKKLIRQSPYLFFFIVFLETTSLGVIIYFLIAASRLKIEDGKLIFIEVVIVSLSIVLMTLFCVIIATVLRNNFFVTQHRVVSSIINIQNRNIILSMLQNTSKFSFNSKARINPTIIYDLQ